MLCAGGGLGQCVGQLSFILELLAEHLLALYDDVKTAFLGSGWSYCRLAPAYCIMDG